MPQTIESAGGRNSGKPQCGDGKAPHRDGHPLSHSLKAIHLPHAGAMDHGARAQEQKIRHKAEEDKLQKAADKALRAYPEFAVRPVLYEGRVCYEKNDAPVKLAPDDGKRLYFGTEDTNGYLFVFLYGERHLSFSIFHSQTDAHGMICFLVTVMWNYLVNVFPPARLIGTKLFTQHGVRADDRLFYTMDDAERFDPLTVFARPGDMVQPVDVQRLFRFPPEDAPKDSPTCRLVNLESINELTVTGRRIEELINSNTTARQSLADGSDNSIRSIESRGDATLQTGLHLLEITEITIFLTVIGKEIEQTYSVLIERLIASLPLARVITRVQNKLQTTKTTILTKGSQLIKGGLTVFAL